MPNAENFSDIQSHWAQKCIVQLAQQQVINGYPDRSFRPESTITRAEFAAMLLKAFPNIKPVRDAVVFTDVPENHWAYKAIKFASETSFFEGYPDRTFKPELVLTRVQAIAILANGLKYQPMSPPTETLRKYFDDAADIPSYARSAIAAATENFLIVNYPNVRKLQPNKNATRGEIVALLCQALKIENVLPPQYTPWSEFLVILPIFDGAESFSSGVAWVKIGKKWGVIDKTGKLLIQPEYYLHYPFVKGLALVTIGGKFRYIDRKGKMVIQPQFESAIYFSEGLAAVKFQDKDGFIDKTGKFVIPPKFNWAFPFSDGVALVVEDGKSGFIDKTGKFTEIILDYTLTDAIGNFSEGFARVSLSIGEGYIDKTGKLAIQPQFRYAAPFSEGLAAVSNGEKSGYINRKGELVIPFRFNGAGSFSEGLAQVEVDGKFSFIDKSGNYVIKPRFSRSYDDISEGFTPVFFGFGKWGYIRTPL